MGVVCHEYDPLRCQPKNLAVKEILSSDSSFDDQQIWGKIISGNKRLSTEILAKATHNSRVVDKVEKLISDWSKNLNMLNEFYNNPNSFFTKLSTTVKDSSIQSSFDQMQILLQEVPVAIAGKIIRKFITICNDDLLIGMVAFTKGAIEMYKEISLDRHEHMIVELQDNLRHFGRTTADIGSNMKTLEKVCDNLKEVAIDISKGTSSGLAAGAKKQSVSTMHRNYSLT